MAEANDMTLRTTGVDAREEVESTEYATVRVPEDTQSGRPRLPGAPDHPNYEILEELGRGGMGIVYRARDRKRNRIVALKTLQGFSPAALYLFKQEFRTLAAVSHANLVTLLELISDGGQWFFTMEYVEGVNFKTYVRDNPPRLRDAFRQLATGLMRMHERSVLHRDLKPGNVMVDGTGRVVILDFGLAEELNRTGAPDDESRQFLGTLAYMSPEQAALKPLGPATDWYSFGVMLYEAITGKLPLSGSPLELIQRKQSADPPAPSQLVPHVSDDLNQLCVGLLHRQAESRPAGADVVAQLSIASDESCGQPSDVSFAHRDAQLFGRESHVADLRDAFAAVQRGEPTVVTISGRSGMGKSALVRSFLSDPAVRERAVILAGRCYEQESVPYKAFDGIIDSLSRYLKRQPTEKVEAILPRDVAPAAILFPVLQQVPAVAHAHRSGTRIPDSKELQKRAFGSLRELFARLGDRRPLIIEIDDLQWGDADSAALLAELLRPPDPPVFLLLAVQRSEDASSSRFLREFERTVAAAQPTVRHHLISVGALAIEEAAALAFTLLDEADVARDVAQKVARESAGNPLFVFELVQNLRAGNVLSGRSSRPGDLVLEDVLWQRVARLPDGARRFLEAVAVAGRPVAVGDASTAAGCDGEDLAVLTQLRSGRLIRCVGSDDNNEVETYHDRVRASIVGHLSAVERVRYHARLAEVLSASGRGDAETLLVHYEAAGDHQRAAACCVKAADQATGTLAFDRAAQLYRRSLELAAAEDPVRRELVRKLADALANAGRGKEAAETYLSLAEEAGDTDGFEYRRRAAMQLLISGHFDQGIDVLAHVLHDAGMRLPATPRRALLAVLSERAMIGLRGLRFRTRRVDEIPREELTRIDVCWAAAAGLTIVDTIRGAYFQTRGLRMALKSGEPYRVVRSLAIEAAHAATAGVRFAGKSDRILRRAEELARDVDNPHATGVVLMSRAIAAYLLGRWRETVDCCEQAESVFRDTCIGAAWELDTVHSFELWARYYCGELAELHRRLPSLLNEAAAKGDLYAQSNLGTFTKPVVSLAADRPDVAERDLQQIARSWSNVGFHVQHYNCELSMLRVLLYRGDGLAAWDRFHAMLPKLRQSLLLRLQVMRILAADFHGRCALAAAQSAANPAEYLPAARRAAAKLFAEGTPWANAQAFLLTAGASVFAGDDARAVTALQNAVKHFDDADMAMHATCARMWLGTLRRNAADRDLAAEATAWLARQGVAAPEQWTGIVAPGFRRTAARR